MVFVVRRLGLRILKMAESLLCRIYALVPMRLLGLPSDLLARAGFVCILDVRLSALLSL